MIYEINYHILSQKCISKHSSISAHSHHVIKRGNKKHACLFQFGFFKSQLPLLPQSSKKSWHLGTGTREKKGIYLNEFRGSRYVLIHAQSDIVMCEFRRQKSTLQKSKMLSRYATKKVYPYIGDEIVATEKKVGG